MSIFDQILPDFWRTSFAEPGLLDVIEKSLGMAYESCYNEVEEAEKNLSVKTALAWHTELYPTIRCTYDNAHDSGNIDGYSTFHKIPALTFEYTNLRDASGNAVPHQIFYDATANQFFLGTNLKTDQTLFADSSLEAWTDHSFSFFFDRSAIDFNPVKWTEVTSIGLKSQVFVVPDLRPDLTRRLAQYVNMVYAATHAPALDFVDSLFSVAFGGEFFESDGTIISVSANSVTVQHESGLKTYSGTPRKTSGKVWRFEAVSPSPVKLYSWFTTPAKFTQMLIADDAQLLSEEMFQSEFRTISAIDGLRHPGNASYEMGGLVPKIDIYGRGRSYGRAHGGNPDYVYEWWLNRKEMLNHPNDPQDWRPTSFGPGVIPENQVFFKHRFQQHPFNFPHPSVGVEHNAMFWWRDFRYPDFIYESMKSLIIWETPIATKWHEWIDRTLQRFKPLNLKFKKSPKSGIVKHQARGYGLGNPWRPERGYGRQRGKAVSSTPPVTAPTYSFSGALGTVESASPFFGSLIFSNVQCTKAPDKDLFVFVVPDGPSGEDASSELTWEEAIAGGSFFTVNALAKKIVMRGRKTSEAVFTDLAEAPITIPVLYSFKVADYSSTDGAVTMPMHYRELACSAAPDMDLYQLKGFNSSGVFAGGTPVGNWASLHNAFGSGEGEFNVDPVIVGYSTITVRLFGKKLGDTEFTLLASAESFNSPV